MSTVSTVLDESRLLLNDVGAKLFTNTVLLPPFKKAYRELQQVLADNGLSKTRKQSADLTVAAGVTELTYSSTPALPADFLRPIQLLEKPSGADDTQFVSMVEHEWLDNTIQQETLGYWAYIGENIELNGATVDVVVRLRYFGSLTAITSANDTILVADSETFLAARTASIAATTLGGSPQRGGILQSDASNALNILVSSMVKGRQNQPVRRRPFRSFRRWGFYYDTRR